MRGRDGRRGLRLVRLEALVGLYVFASAVHTAYVSVGEFAPMHLASTTVEVATYMGWLSRRQPTPERTGRRSGGRTR